MNIASTKGGGIRLALVTTSQQASTAVFDSVFGYIGLQTLDSPNYMSMETNGLRPTKKSSLEVIQTWSIHPPVRMLGVDVNS